MRHQRRLSPAMPVCACRPAHCCPAVLILLPATGLLWPPPPPCNLRRKRLSHGGRFKRLVSGALQNNDDGNERGGAASKMSLQAGVRAGFLLPAKLSADITVNLFPKDRITLSTDDAIYMDKKFGDRSAINGVAYLANGTTAILAGHKPSPSSFEQRQYVIFLLADAVRSNLSYTVKAPAVLILGERKRVVALPLLPATTTSLSAVFGHAGFF